MFPWIPPCGCLSLCNQLSHNWHKKRQNERIWRHIRHIRWRRQTVKTVARSAGHAPWRPPVHAVEGPSDFLLSCELRTFCLGWKSLSYVNVHWTYPWSAVRWVTPSGQRISRGGGTKGLLGLSEIGYALPGGCLSQAPNPHGLVSMIFHLHTTFKWMKIHSFFKTAHFQGDFNLCPSISTKKITDLEILTNLQPLIETNLWPWKNKGRKVNSDNSLCSSPHCVKCL